MSGPSTSAVGIIFIQFYGVESSVIKLVPPPGFSTENLSRIKDKIFQKANELFPMANCQLAQWRILGPIAMYVASVVKARQHWEEGSLDQSQQPGSPNPPVESTITCPGRKWGLNLRFAICCWHQVLMEKVVRVRKDPTNWTGYRIDCDNDADIINV